MPYTLNPTVEFVEQMRKLDKSIRGMVDKKLDRIMRNPTLSKPLEHGAGMYSERVKNFRIVFKVSGSEIILYRVKKRDEAYLP